MRGRLATQQTTVPTEHGGIIHEQFQLGAWYQGVLHEVPLTFQVVELKSCSLMRIRVFRDFHRGRMLTTEEWIKGEDLTVTKDVMEPQDAGSW